MWWGRERNKGLEPWRDTGVACAGPAVADIEAAFAEVWAAPGARCPTRNARRRPTAPAGTTSLRVIDTKPSTGGLFRLDQLVAALARERLWITDAYFVGASPVHPGADRRGLRRRRRAAAGAGSGSDLPIVQRLTQAGYRTLLEAGVRIFEWNGAMVHAKTAVADGRWARVGSSNLNVAELAGQLGARRRGRGRTPSRARWSGRSSRTCRTPPRSSSSNTNSVLPCGMCASTVRQPRWRRRDAAARVAPRRGRTAGGPNVRRGHHRAAWPRRGRSRDAIWGIVFVAALGIVGLKWPRGWPIRWASCCCGSRSAGRCRPSSCGRSVDSNRPRSAIAWRPLEKTPPETNGVSLVVNRLHPLSAEAFMARPPMAGLSPSSGARISATSGDGHRLLWPLTQLARHRYAASADQNPNRAINCTVRATLPELMICPKVGQAEADHRAREIGIVEEVDHFQPQRQRRRADTLRLLHREVPVVPPRRAKSRVDTRRIAKSERRRPRPRRGIQPRDTAAGRIVFAGIGGASDPRRARRWDAGCCRAGWSCCSPGRCGSGSRSGGSRRPSRSSRQPARAGRRPGSASDAPRRTAARWWS